MAMSAGAATSHPSGVELNIRTYVEGHVKDEIGKFMEKMKDEIDKK